ncbi:MAG: glycosyltransferase family 2 protein [Candidatus Omnitrophica bacterium]|nr:glycosyltransferase family 2 protein [Candidatus Omnitrophota bacterium]
MAENPFLSVVMPALNEEKNIILAISNTLKAFNDLKIDGEIVVINDGSTDRTSTLVIDLIAKEKERIRLVNHESPHGYGASFWDGIDSARGGIVTLLPGDNENDPREILRYLKLLNDVDIVVPFVYNKRVRSVFRNILSRIYLSVVNFTFGTHFNYTNGTMLYRKSILKELEHRSFSFFFQTDILVRAVKRGHLFAEVPYSLGKRKAGDSKAVTLSNFLRIALDYFTLVRDIYISRKEKLKDKSFTADNVSRKRHP